MNTRDCLQVFNLDSSANSEDLKLAYRKAVRHWHPDRYQQATSEARSAAEKQMQILNAAYETLAKYYGEHGYMPGYIPPVEDVEPFAGTTTSTPSANSSQTQHDTWTTVRPTKTDSEPVNSKIEPAKTSKQAGKIGFTVAVVIIIFIYLSSDVTDQNTTPVELAAVATKQKTVEESLGSASQARIDSKDSSVKSDEKSGEEIKSPFVSKERKSAFEQTSRLGIYGESADEKYFTYGDTAGRVFEVQGVPTKTEGDIWYYGQSEVHFQEGRVKSWYVAEGSRLKAKIER